MSGINRERSLFYDLIQNIMYLVYSLLCAVLLLTIISCEQSVNEMEIYGVRWFLAQRFRYNIPSLVATLDGNRIYDLMAIFNSQNNSQNSRYFISVQEQAFDCYVKQVTIEITDDLHLNFNGLASKVGQRFTTYIYKCPIKFKRDRYLENQVSFDYAIWVELQGQKTQIFTSTLKSPLFEGNDLKAVVLGDWGLIDKNTVYSASIAQIDDCLAQQAKSQGINLMILLGDLGYDMQGQSYIKFLTYLQKFSQNIPILFTPGNHELTKHHSIFPLVIESFYSPFWNDFQGYFQLAKIGKYMFLGYNPDSYFGTSLYTQNYQYKFGSHLQFFNKQFDQNIIADIYSNYTTITFGHYPIFCSEQNQYDNCSEYQQKQGPYLKILQRLGIDLMFSAHLHFYQRSKPICFDANHYLQSNSSQQVDYYQMKTCPVFVIEGAAGNNYFVMNELQFELKKTTRKFVGNTGFGILTLSKLQTKIDFIHISAKRQCTSEDHFIFQNNPKSLSISNFINQTRSLILLCAIIVLMSIGYILKQLHLKRLKQFSQESQVLSEAGSGFEMDKLQI